LDLKNYEKYISTSAPEYILYDHLSIDGRHPMWDESITKRALLSNYLLIHGDTNLKMTERFDEEFYLRTYSDVRTAVETGYFKNAYEHYSKYGVCENRLRNAYEADLYLLFKKREIPLKEIEIREKEVIIEIGKEYPLDVTENPQYLYAEINYDLTGKIKRLLFQPPPINITTYCEDGTVQHYRAVVPIFKTGILINKKTDTRYESLLFFLDKGKQNKNITKIKFEAEYGYEKKIKGVIKEIYFE
jgi:hypothetical protein